MVTIVTPATTANLGPGFDCLGCALSLYNRFEFEEIDSGYEITGCPPEYAGADNLCAVAYRAAMERMGMRPRGLRVAIDSRIPLSRGLGSSASCIVAGALAANALHGNPLSEDEALCVATGVEGHPDNVAPCLLGGLTASFLQEGRVRTVRFTPHPSIRFCALIPDFELSTAKARAALPAQVPFADAVYNLSRAALLPRALEAGDTGAVAAALTDRLHQPYRKALIPEYDRVRETALACGAFAFCVSGAGPTLLALYQDDAFPARAEEALRPFAHAWQVLPLAVDAAGSKVL